MEGIKKFRVSIISIWVGILIPIVAALIPYGVSWLFPKNGLSYTVSEPISIKGNDIFKIVIKNDGDELENNIVINIKRNPKYKPPDSKAKRKSIIVESDTETIIEEKRSEYIIKAGNIRPKDKISLVVFSKFSWIISYSIDRDVKVKSDQHLGKFDSNFLKNEIYPITFWIFILLMILIFLGGLYQEYIMDPRKREKLLWEELEKIDRKIDANNT